MNNTNWNLYKSFVAVYEMKNLTKASIMLDISRPSVSRNLKELSDQLGVTLFTPTQRGVEPTIEAHGFYPEIKNAVISITKAERSIATFNNKNCGVVKMVVQTTVAEFYIKKYMRDFCVKYPSIALEFFKEDSIKLLEQRRVDFAIDLDSKFSNGNFETIALFVETGILVATREFLKKHGLSETMSREDLLKLPLVVHGERWAYFNEQIASKSNPIKMISTEPAYSMTKNSLGVGCISKEDLLTVFNDTDLVILSVKDIVFPPVQIVCGYNNSLSHPAQFFINGFLEFLRNY